MAICYVILPFTGRGGFIIRLPAAALVLVSPVIGYLPIARPFARWADLDASLQRVCIVASGVYWAIHFPLMVFWLLLSLEILFGPCCH